MPGFRFLAKTRSKLGRTAKQRKHLFRSMATQLIEHERIRTTFAKAKYLQPIAERLVAYQKRENVDVQKKALNFLTTEYSKKKLRMELTPRLHDKNGRCTRVVRIGNRGGDKAPMAYIEFIDNEIDKYEQALKKQNLETGVEPNKVVWEKKIFTQERDFFIAKVEEAEADLARLDDESETLLVEGTLKVEDLQQKRRALENKRDLFKKNLIRVEHDLFILNKNKYDLIKFSHIC